MTERDVQLRLDGDLSLAELIDTTDFVIDFIGHKSASGSTRLKISTYLSG